MIEFSEIIPGKAFARRKSDGGFEFRDRNLSRLLDYVREFGIWAGDPERVLVTWDRDVTDLDLSTVTRIHGTTWSGNYEGGGGYGCIGFHHENQMFVRKTLRHNLGWETSIHIAGSALALAIAEPSSSKIAR